MLKDDTTKTPTRPPRSQREFDNDDGAHAAAEEHHRDETDFDDTDDDEDRDDGLTDDDSGHRRSSALSRVFDALPASSGLWNAMTGVSLVVAALLVLSGYVDAAFVVATLGILAWFIEKRNRLQADNPEEND